MGVSFGRAFRYNLFFLFRLRPINKKGFSLQSLTHFFILFYVRCHSELVEESEILYFEMLILNDKFYFYLMLLRQIRTQPTFSFIKFYIFTFRKIFNLIHFYFTNSEIFCFWISKIITRNR